MLAGIKAWQLLEEVLTIEDESFKAENSAYSVVYESFTSHKSAPMTCIRDLKVDQSSRVYSTQSCRK